MAVRELHRLSLETIKVQVTTTGGKNPTTDPVSIAVAIVYTQPVTWVTATWVTVAGVYYATVQIGPGSTIGALPVGQYGVYVRITDSPDIPVLQADDVIVIE